MSDLKTFWQAVTTMRAAQKLEWDALPSNFRIYKRSRQQQTVSKLEQSVDELAQELFARYHWSDGEEQDDTPRIKGK